MPMPFLAASSPERIELVRRFNRFYTRQIGVLGEVLLETRFTLTESRLLWELAHCEGTSTASRLRDALDLDAGYLSRLLRGLQNRGLISRERGTADARHFHLSLTAAGKRAFAPLDARAREQVQAMLEPLDDLQQQALLQALATVTRLLDRDAKAKPDTYLLRPQRPGDMGWVVSRHAAIYAQEYRWNEQFEAMVARIAADFIERFDARREACWIAEREGANVGCVVLVQSRDEPTRRPLRGVAQLRLLLVEPSARGLGIGQRLVDECTRFAEQAGYRRIRLWTNSLLTAARLLYERAGYRLIASEPHRSFGHRLIGETWERVLR